MSTTSNNNNNYPHLSQQPLPQQMNQKYYDHPQVTTSKSMTASATVSSSSSLTQQPNSSRGQQQHHLSSKKKLSKQEEIDSYAQQLIEYTARTQQQQQQLEDDDEHNNNDTNHSHIDDSLGSYITNCLRTSLSEMMNINVNDNDNTNIHPILIMLDITTIPDYESFCELIQEHCQLSMLHDNDSNDELQYQHQQQQYHHHSDDDVYNRTNPIAVQVLQKILNVLITQQIPSDDVILFQNSQLPLQPQNYNHVPTNIHHNNNNNNINDDPIVVDFTNNSLLPESLWNDVLAETVHHNVHDDNVTETNDDILKQQQSDTKHSMTVSTLPPNSTSIVPPHPPSSSPQDGRSMIVSPDQNDATITTTTTTTMTPQHDDDEGNEHPHEPLLQQQYEEHDDHEYHHQQQQQHNDVDEYIRSNLVNMLLQWYVAQDLSYDAAYGAACLGQNNIILAQYIISSALTQIPICKHLLNDGKCYRADCTFNHNIDSHTCVFWMKSRGCSKRDSTIDPCRFLHGFSSKILDNIPEPIQLQAAAASHTHNSTVITPYRNIRDFYATSVPTNSTNSTASTETTADDYYYSNTNTTNNSKSFAKIASQGYSTQKSFAQQLQPPDQPPTGNAAASIQQVLQQLPTMLIPQNLWQAHENRDASAFYISDPLERYYTVASTTSTSSNSNHQKNNNNVIDLHYQSIKTFPIVLDTILPNKLSQLLPSEMEPNGNTNSDDGIWIVTGTGHHVNTQRTHQKGGSTLENAVLEYLISNYVLQHPSTSDSSSATNIPNRYRIYKGRDRNGKGGAIYIRRKY